MSNPEPTAAFPLGLDLPKTGVRRALHDQLRAAILAGRLSPGLRLPASRALAAGLGVSRNSVLAAYDLLASEGYLSGRAGAGVFVADVLPRPAQPPLRGGEGDTRLSPLWRHARPPPPRLPAPRYDLRLGAPDKALFPFDIWRRLYGRSLRAMAREPVTPWDPQGPLALREAIVRHISFTRAVACPPQDLVTTSGAQQAFDLLGKVLVEPGRTVVAVEDPGYPPVRAAFAAAGARVQPVPVDGEGLVVEALPRDAAVICVTPSHQFPLGMPMSTRRRAALLDHARATDAVIVEDDYDSEYRFLGRAVDALQTLDREGRVFYVGTFSKVLSPELRIGFIAAPTWARAALGAARRAGDLHGSAIAEQALTDFIVEGRLASHVRRMRRVYEARRRTLLGVLASGPPGLVTAMPSVAGLHVAVRLGGGLEATSLAARLLERGVGVEPLQKYASLGEHHDKLGLGYGAVATADVEPAARILLEEALAAAR